MCGPIRISELRVEHYEYQRYPSLLIMCNLILLTTIFDSEVKSVLPNAKSTDRNMVIDNHSRESLLVRVASDSDECHVGSGHYK